MERARRLERASLRRSSIDESIDMYLSLSPRIRSILKACPPSTVRVPPFAWRAWAFHTHDARGLCLRPLP